MLNMIVLNIYIYWHTSQICFSKDYQGQKRQLMRLAVLLLYQIIFLVTDIRINICLIIRFRIFIFFPFYLHKLFLFFTFFILLFFTSFILLFFTSFILLFFPFFYTLKWINLKASWASITIARIDFLLDLKCLSCTVFYDKIWRRMIISDVMLYCIILHYIVLGCISW